MATKITNITEHIPEEDRGLDNPTTFWFIETTPEEIEKIIQGKIELKKITKETLKESVAFMEKYISDWKNIIGLDEKDLPYAPGVLGKQPLSFINYVSDCMIDAMREAKNKYKKK